MLTSYVAMTSAMSPFRHDVQTFELNNIQLAYWYRLLPTKIGRPLVTHINDDDDDEIAYFTVRWKTRASFVYRTKNVDNNDKDSKNRKRSH